MVQNIIREFPEQLGIALETPDYVPIRMRCYFCQDVVPALICSDECHHRACFRCLNFLQVKQVTHCSICSSNSSAPSSTTPKVHVQKLSWGEVYEFNVSCPGREFGCKYQVKARNFKNLLDHCKRCGNRPELCTNEGCYLLMAKGSLPQHLELKCSKRSMECPDCNIFFFADEFQNHRSECEMERVQCNYCEKKGIRRKDLPTHYHVCDCVPKPCKLYFMGCQFFGRKEELAEHESLQGHLDLIVNFWEEKHEMEEVMRQEITALKDEVAIHGQELAEVFQSYYKIQQALADLQDGNKDHGDAGKSPVVPASPLAAEMVSRECPFVWPVKNFEMLRRKYNSSLPSPTMILSFSGTPVQMTVKLMVWLSGCGKGKNSHLSVYLRAVNHKERDFHNSPQLWCLIRLVNQTRQDKDYDVKVPLNTERWSYCFDPESHSVNSFVFKDERFMPHSYLKRGFLKDNSLLFQVEVIS